MFDRPDAFPLKNPAVRAPETDSAERVPTDVMFGWAFPVTATARVEVATAPTIFAACKDERACPDPTMRPETRREVSVPTDVMFGCALPDTATVNGTEPTRVDARTPYIPNPSPTNVPAERVPATVSDVSEPTDVMFGWDACVTTVAVTALATLPWMFEAWIFDRPEPSPRKVLPIKICPETVPVISTSPPTLRFDRVPRDVMFD